MSPRLPHRGRLSRRRRVAYLLAAALLVALLAGGSARLLGSPGSAAASGATGEPSVQTDDSVPAREVTMLGSSPNESAGETWGIGQVGAQAQPTWSMVRYAQAGGWSLDAPFENAAGRPLQGFEPASLLSSAGQSYELAGRTSAGGTGVVVGTAATEGGEGTRQVVLARAPGGGFKEAPLTSEGAESVLKAGEVLFTERRAPLIAALDGGEGSSSGGVLVVPIASSASGAETSVLHWDGSAWTREQIEVPAASQEEGGFRVLSIAGTTPSNAWLLAELSSQSNSVALFRRQGTGSEAKWVPVAPSNGGAPGEALRVPVSGPPGEVGFTVAGVGEPPAAKAQILTVTDEGVWIDGLRTDSQAPVTMFFKPEGNGLQGGVKASWCQDASLPCTYGLPQALPTGPSRSFAWANPGNSSGYGDRVITGLPEGVSLKLTGNTFTRVLALGGSEAPNDVGATHGAAFSSPQEGWLGNETLPVHLTSSPAPNRMEPYPVPFRYALTAVAPQPGVPLGALTSQALAVGDQGEVARYIPGQGWLPESLLGAAGHIVKPRLRGVAWPVQGRAYAVGELGQMWLWRGETGLWEPDPAAPINFRGNLLAIAFDPASSSRGYAVGQQGVLLRYGKSWTQEPFCGEAGAPEAPRCLPTQVSGASFSSVAFAGPEALVAYRKLIKTHTGAETYVGGILTNDGSGWNIDAGAATALGTNVPWAVAGLPDGGAALSGTPEGLSGTPVIIERGSSGSAWEPTAAPYPGLEAPGSLAIFREGGAVRVVGAGGVPRTFAVDSVRPPPAGFPPNLIQPYPIETGYVIRQTATGWSDEEHDRNPVLAPPANYKRYDQVFQGDPSSAVLVDPTGARGWVVGGFIDPEQGRGDTADISRYPAEAGAAPGAGQAPVSVVAGQAAFAIGGGSQCAAPCADRANAGIGPDAWISSALSQAGQIAGLRAFLYTGPRVTTGETAGPPTGIAVFGTPYPRELGRYASLLSSSPVPAYAAPSSTDLAEGSGCAFQQAFAAFPAPFGQGAPAAGIAPVSHSAEECAPGLQSGYYSMDSSGPAGVVRVIILDESHDVGPNQRAWLSQQLDAAKALGRPAIVVGAADLNAAIESSDGAAAQVASILVTHGASAYFYYTPEQNIHRTLTFGSQSIPAFGSGTLGYVNSVSSEQQSFAGHSGFLLAQIQISARSAATNRAPVTVSLIPNVGELAMEAKDGVLLRRSQPALFDALARRPRAGGDAQGGGTRSESALYIPIPANCVGSACASGIFPEFTFSSSRPDIGAFVAPNLASSDPHAVLLGPDEKPIPDEHSGLFCAYNAGTTVVTINAGGRAASLSVTVQAGSVRRPCGTIPLKLPATAHKPVATPPAPAPAGAAPAPATAPPLLPPPPVVAAAVVVHPPAPVQPTPFFTTVSTFSPVPPFVPPPLPAAANPTPPSGTSPVNAQAPEREEEEESATESVSNQAVAYRETEHEPIAPFILGAMILAAFAGAAGRRRPRGRREVRVAPATISSMRTQRALARERRRRG